MENIKNSFLSLLEAIENEGINLEDIDLRIDMNYNNRVNALDVHLLGKRLDNDKIVIMINASKFLGKEA